LRSLWRRQIGDRVADKVIVTTGEFAYRRPDGVAVIPRALLGPQHHSGCDPVPGRNRCESRRKRVDQQGCEPHGTAIPVGPQIANQIDECAVD
jgi:hypothetical protein